MIQTFSRCSSRSTLTRHSGLGAAILLSIAALAGCATQHVLQMTFHTDPEGATIYEDGRRWGYTPITLNYPGAATVFGQNACLHLRPVQARWASGASAVVNNVVACPANGWNQQFSLLRPANAPGAEIDANFALQIQRNGIMQQQADAQDATAVATFIESQNAARASAH